MNMKNSAYSTSFALASVIILTALPAIGAQVYNSDLVVAGSTCTGAGCTNGMTFGFDTLAVTGGNPSVLFDDTSSSASFPTQNWRVGVDNAAPSSTFYIANVDTGATVLAATANGVALGSGSTVVNGAISVGAVGNLRKVVNVADGTAASDAATFGQFNAQIGTTITNLQTLYGAQIAAQTAQLAALDQRINSVGAIGSAMSALVINPRASGNTQMSVGLGHYAGETAVAIGGFHFSQSGAVLTNLGVAGTTSGGPLAYRAGVTIGW